MKIFFSWLIFIVIIAGLVMIFWNRHWYIRHMPKLPTMTGGQAVLFGFASAFMWVEVLKWGVHKPFNCLHCMCGWFTVLLAVLFHVPFWSFYLPVGVAVGAIYSAIKMRYL